MKKLITRIALAASAVFALATSSFAQTNLGADCGCPSVSSRSTVLLSSLATVGGANDGELTATNTILDCSKLYIMDKKIYVPDGKSLSINPGVVIKARAYSTADSATSLIVNRGGKIFANGTENCQIVFTAEADPMDGSYSLTNKGKWGGICIAGKATNNLKLAQNGPFQVGVAGKLCVADGLGVFEGFNSAAAKNQYGADLTAGETFDDNDNSGIMTYVSIRFSGAILVLGGEINGLSLGSVGRGTTLDHIEIISNNDDAIEMYGGTVNVKHFATLFNNDDMFDYDQAYSGKAQFIFGIRASDTTVSADADNAFEMDADDQKSNILPRSHPVIYNATMIGNAKKTLSSDNSGLSALQAKEYTEGEVYNSIFANFRYGLNLIKATGTRTGGFEAYHNWANTGGNGSNSLIVKCNTFVGNTRDIAVDRNAAGVVLATDSTQFFTTDLNTSATSLPGFVPTWAANFTTNVVTTKFDAIPNPQITNAAGCPTPAADGFFTPVTYKGAFPASGKNWLSNWAYTQLINVTSGLQPCPTDINADGITNNVDFLILLGQFNQSCQ